MKLNALYVAMGKLWLSQKTILVMKLTTLLLFLAFLQCSAKVYSQKVNINEINSPLKRVLKIINKQTGYVFFYESKAIRNKIITVNIKDKTLNEALASCFQNQQLSFEIINNTVFIKEDEIQRVTTTTVPVSIAALIVTGIVNDENSIPLPGVTVKLKGGNAAAITDVNGRFKIEVPDAGGSLVFSFIGYSPQEVKILPGSPLTIKMQKDESKLKEVIVIGYGTQDKQKLTTSVASVSGTTLNKRVATDPTNLLQGQLPGLSVVQNSAEPGNEGTNLQVRGPGTFSNAGTSPLVIVDGIPGSLSALNPNNIESATLLKDAASQAIYGSRGANGVLVIKTKKGTNSGGFALDYNYNIGFSKASRLPDLITNSATYMSLANQAYTNSGFQPKYTEAQIASYRDATDRTLFPNNNAMEAIFRTATVQNHFLNLSGGSNATTYFVGLGITDQPGTMLGFDYKKYTLSIAINSRINKRVTFGTDFQARYGVRKSPSNGAIDQFLSALAQPPTYPLKYQGKYINSAFGTEEHNKNPLLVAENEFLNEKDYYAQGNLSLNVDIIDGLKWENRAGFTFDFYKNSQFSAIIPTYNFPSLTQAATFGDGSLNQAKNDNVFGLIYSQFSYAKQFGKHNLSAIAGVEEQQNTFSGLNAGRINFPTNLLTDLNAGPASGSTNGGQTTVWAIRSFYSRLNYDFNDKYLLGASFRRDGSSRFLPGKQWGSFYAFSAGWRISQEAFLKDVTWINDLKIRGSWGLVGNQNIGSNGNPNYPYPAQALLSQSAYPFSGVATTGFGATQLIDPSITWESTRTTDIGIDLTILNNKLNITADYFNKYTYNILRGSQVPYFIGLSAPTVNNGAVDNKGLEFAISYKDRIGKDFGFYISPNFQLYRNKLVSFGAQEIGGNTINRQGLPLNSYYLYVWDGIFQNQAQINSSPTQPITPTPGDLKIKDINGDGVINDADRTVVSGAYPSFTFAANLGANYKQFDLNIQVYGVQGVKNYVTGWGIEPFNQGSTPTTEWLNAWTPTNPSNVLPKIYVSRPGYQGVDGYASTYFLRDASFVRIKNVQIGYTIPDLVIKKIGVKSLRFYAAGDNLFLFSKFPGLDPERVSNNSPTYLNYPQNRTFTFGVSAKL